MTAFDFAIISDDSFVGAYLEMGKVLEKLNKINQAIEQYEIVTKIDDPNPFALYRIGCCHNKLGNTELASSFFNFLDPRSPISSISSTGGRLPISGVFLAKLSNCSVAFSLGL